MVELIKAANLTSLFNSTTNSTLFAPNNDAFAQLPNDTISELKNDTSKLQDFLLYMLVPQLITSANLRNNEVLVTEDKEKNTLFTNVYKNPSGTIMTVNDAKFLLEDASSGNNDIHIIDKVIFASNNTVSSALSTDPRFTILSKLLTNMGFNSTALTTVFAPTDEAFEAIFPPDLLASLLSSSSNNSLLNSLLLNHVINGSWVSKGFFSGLKLKSEAGTHLTITNSTTSESEFLINGYSKVIEVDMIQKDGVIHVVDHVIIPNNFTIADILKLEELTILAGMLKNTTSSNGTITLFAPDDKALSAIGNSTVNLKYHEVSGELFTSNFTNEKMVATRNGHDVRLNVYNVSNGESSFTVYTVNCANIAARDLRASNGVVQVIDMVLTPPNDTIAMEVASRSDLSTLQTMLIEFNLTDILSGSGPLTLFAPDDTAWASLSNSTLSNSTLMREILLFHIVNGTQCSAGLSATLITLEGDPLPIELGNDTLLVDGATLVQKDILAKNGVIQVISEVLIPGVSPNATLPHGTTTPSTPVQANSASQVGFYFAITAFIVMLLV